MDSTLDHKHAFTGCQIFTVSFPIQHIPYAVVDIKTIGDRIVCSDIQESVHFLKYRPLENQVSSTILSQFTVTY